MKEDIQLTDGSVLLRPCRLSDLAALYETVRESRTELSAWMGGWWLSDYSFEDCRTWLEAQAGKWGHEDSYILVIIDPRETYLLGGCSLRITDKSFKIADLAYWVRTSRTKQGIATAATRLLTRFGFSELKLNRIEIVTGVDNKASQRIAEKLGATREGVLRNRLVVNGKTSDAVMFSLILQDINQLSQVCPLT